MDTKQGLYSMRSVFSRNWVRPAFYASILLAVVILMWLLLRGPDYQYVEPEGNYPIQHHLSYAFTVRNNTNRILNGAQLWVYAPVRRTASQRATEIKVSHSHRLVPDDLGNQLLYFEFDDLAKGEEISISVAAATQHADAPNPILEPNLERYLQAGYGIEADAPEITALAGTLRAETTAQTVANNLNWLAENIKLSVAENLSIEAADQAAVKSDTADRQTEPALDAFGAKVSKEQETNPKPASESMPEKITAGSEVIAVPDASTPRANPYGALAAQKTGQGSKIDRLLLLTALNRASNIPSRSVVGFRHDDKTSRSVQDLHTWVEYYDQGVWHIADPETKAIDTQQSSYIALRVLDRFPETVILQADQLLYGSVGLEVKLQ